MWHVRAAHHVETFSISIVAAEFKATVHIQKWATDSSPYLLVVGAVSL